MGKQGPPAGDRLKRGGHEATETGLAYAPVSQAHGHNHIEEGGGGGNSPPPQHYIPHSTPKTFPYPNTSPNRIFNCQ